LFERAASLDQYWQDAAHALKDARHVVDIRNLGLVAGIELEPRRGAPGRRAYETFVKSFEAGVLIRYNRRHDRLLAAADHRETADRQDFRNYPVDPQRAGLDRALTPITSLTTSRRR